MSPQPSDIAVFIISPNGASKAWNCQILTKKLSKPGLQRGQNYVLRRVMQLFGISKFLNQNHFLSIPAPDNNGFELFTLQVTSQTGVLTVLQRDTANKGLWNLETIIQAAGWSGNEFGSFVLCRLPQRGNRYAMKIKISPGLDGRDRFSRQWCSDVQLEFQC